MTPPKYEKILQELNALLDRERDALLFGDLTSLPGFLLEKERLITDLEKFEIVNIDHISNTQSIMTRNQSLMSGALSGVQDVAARLKAVRQARGALETYNRSGFRSRVTIQVTGKVEKRA